MIVTLIYNTVVSEEAFKLNGCTRKTTSRNMHDDEVKAEELWTHFALLGQSILLEMVQLGW